MIKSKEILNKLTEASDKLVWKTTRSGSYEASTKNYKLEVYPKDRNWIGAVLDNHYKEIVSKSFTTGPSLNPVKDCKDFCQQYVDRYVKRN